VDKILTALWLASLEYGVPYEILYALATVESGLNPLAVNIAGRSYYPRTREEVLRLIGGERNYDLGLMQINSYWVRKLDLRPEWLLDPGFNAKVGAFVLRYCMSRFGNTWKAIDCYHRGESRARERSSYVSRVCSVIYGKEVCF